MILDFYPGLPHILEMTRVFSTSLPICPGGENCMKEEDWPVIMEPSCETLFMCIITTLKEGVRSGGGISDVLRKPAASVSVCVCVGKGGGGGRG